MGLVAQNQQTSFANPANGQSPMDADVVRNNDNALVAKLNAHDADATIHVQTGLLSARPAATTPYAMYMDENRRLYVANGTVWTEIPYLKAGDSVTGGITFSGTVTAGTFSGSGASLTAVPATQLSGTVPIGNLPTAPTFTGTVTGASVLANNGQLRGARVTQSGAGGSINFSVANHYRQTLTGNGTMTLSGGVAGGIYTLEVVQDATGSRNVIFAGGVIWPNGLQPSVTTTPNRKDVYTFFFDGTSYLGQQFGVNYASTA